MRQRFLCMPKTIRAISNPILNIAISIDIKKYLPHKGELFSYLYIFTFTEHRTQNIKQPSKLLGIPIPPYSYLSVFFSRTLHGVHAPRRGLALPSCAVHPSIVRSGHKRRCFKCLLTEKPTHTRHTKGPGTKGKKREFNAHVEKLLCIFHFIFIAYTIRVCGRSVPEIVLF